MKTDSFVKCTLNYSDVPAEAIKEYEGKKQLFFEIHERKTPDSYGNTHYLSIRVRNADGAYETKYIGKGKLATFQKGDGGATTREYSQANYPTAQPAPQPNAVSLNQDNGDNDLPF